MRSVRLSTSALVIMMVSVVIISCGTNGAAPSLGCDRPTSPPSPPGCSSSSSCTYSLSGKTAVAIPPGGGFWGTLALALNNAPAGSSITLTSYISQPPRGPQPLDLVRSSGLKSQASVTIPGTPIFWLSATYSSAVTFKGLPASSWIIPESAGMSGAVELETFDGTSGTMLDVETAGFADGKVTFPGTATAFAAVPGHTYWLEVIVDVPSPGNRLYVSDGVSNPMNPGTIKAYSWPTTRLGTPSTTLAGDWGPTGMAFDAAGRLYIVNHGLVSLSSHWHDPLVQVYTQPILDGAMPALKLNGPHNGPCPHHPYGGCVETGTESDVAIDATGNVAVAIYAKTCSEFACGSSRGIVLYAAPVTSSSSVGCGLGDVSGAGFVAQYTGIAFDQYHNLWAGRSDGYLDEYKNAACNASPSFSLHEAAADVKFDSVGNMYVANGSNGIDVYKPPFSPSMTKAFSIVVPQPQYLAFGPRGDLFVNSANANVLVFVPPFTSGSKSALTLPTAVSGLAIGP